MAVVAIFALIAGITLPNLSSLHARNLKHEAQRLVAQLELARQRSIVTGVPHRVLLDLDAGLYRVEWLATDSMLAGEATDDPFGIDGSGADASQLTDFDGLGDFGDLERAPIDFRAPVAEEASYRPIAGTLGRFEELEAPLVFAGVETDGGWIEAGETWVAFERDGSADPTRIEIEHESGLAAILEVLPLADRVRVEYETD